MALAVATSCDDRVQIKASKWFALVEFFARPIIRTPTQVAQRVITLLTAPEFATSNGGFHVHA